MTTEDRIIDMRIIRERVSRGAALLDSVKPGWRWLVDTGRLNMAADDLCVLGQIWGQYGIGAAALRLDTTYAREGHGFIGLTGGAWEYEDLTSAWRQEISGWCAARGR